MITNFNIEFKLNDGRRLTHAINQDVNGNVVNEAEGKIWDVKGTMPNALQVAIRTAVTDASEKSKDGITSNNIERIVNDIYKEISMGHGRKIVVEVR